MRRLREYRQRAGLTQVQLSSLSGVHQTHISKLELGLCPRPSYAIVAKLASALDLEPAAIADESEALQTEVAS